MPRTIAIGDIHGCPDALDAVVAAFDPTLDDEVVTLGDYVNRGPNSRGVLDRLIDLGHRCRLVSILGNHDQVMLDVLEGRAETSLLIAMGGKTTLASYGRSGPPLRPSDVPPEHLEFLQNCVDHHETADHLFVHASYAPYLPMIGQLPHTLRWESLRDEVPGPHQSCKRVVTGHTSQKKGQIYDLGYLTCIDTYCYGGGWLTALDVHSGQTWQADRRGRLRPNPQRLVPWGV
jgi:serine/threonine protein phosphatase 1